MLRLAFSLMPFIVAAPLPAPAASPDIPGYITTVWREKDGAPGDIRSMAQTKDGWLWLGTSSGLFRFDGTAFALQDLATENFAGARLVSDMAAAPDGSLWVVYGRASAVQLGADGVTVRHPPGLPGDNINGIFLDGRGRAFAVAGDQIFEFDGSRWTPCNSPRWILPGGVINAAAVDGTGAVIANTSDGVYRLPPGSTTFSRMPGIQGSEGSAFFGAPDGRMWRTMGRGFEPVPGVKSSRTHAGSGSDIFASDSRGGFWSMVEGCPALCLRRGGVDPAEESMSRPGVDIFPSDRDGLQPMTLLSDANGDVWLGGKDGLARFHPTDVRPVDLGYQAYYFAVMPMHDGNVLVGAESNWRSDNLVRFTSSGRSIVATNLSTHAMAPWSGDALLHMDRAGLVRKIDGGRLAPWSARPAGMASTFTLFLLADGKGDAFISVRDKGLFLVTGQTWKRLGRADGFPDEAPAVGERDTPDITWLGYNDGKLLALRDNRPVNGGLRETGLGTVSAILPGSPLIVGGERGVAWFDGQAFHPLKMRTGDVLRGVTGLVRTPDGAIWANGRTGLVRVGSGALADAVRGSETDVAFRLLTTDDGLAGGAQQTRGLPSLHLDARGKLWISGVNGLTTVDPSTLNPPAPVRPIILAMTRGDHKPLPANDATLSPKDASLEISFTGLSLTHPRYMQLRYRLRGADTAWRSAEGPGTVRYADLNPGRYQFEMQARASEGDWSPVVRSSTVVRTPAFVETLLFRCLVGLALLAALLAAYTLRVRALRRRHQERTDARLAERDRIARELHDSILQDVQAIAIRLSSWEIDSSIPETMHGRVGAMSRQMRGVVIEGRARVLALRSGVYGNVTLSDAMRLIGDEYEERSDVVFDVIVAGEETALPDHVQTPVLDILREAVRNAFFHARPGTVQVILEFSQGSLQVRVVDDGHGLPEEIRAAGRRPGHWGLVIMRERAAELGGQLDIVSGPGGTTVALTLHVSDEKPVRRWRPPSEYP